MHGAILGILVLDLKRKCLRFSRFNAILYLLMANPVGHFGFVPVIFFTVLPFAHEMVFAGLFAAEVVALGDFDVAETAAAVDVDVDADVDVDVDDEVAVGWLNFTRMVGLENVNPVADNRRKPSESRIEVVATFAVPSTATTETVADTGASVKP